MTSGAEEVRDREAAAAAAADDGDRLDAGISLDERECR